jgi:PleD family two-component response regulator
MPPPKEEPRLPGSTASLDPQAIAKSAPSQVTTTDPLRQLVDMLVAGLKPVQAPVETQKWQRRRVLLCVEEAAMREKLRVGLEAARYEVFSADFAPEAIEILHESRCEVILLSPSFDAEHQGGTAMMQYINSLTPQIRRRTYVVLVSPQLRTLDTYLAFANGVNLTLHPEDATSFQSVLERSIRDFNELYRPWNLANASHPF